MSSVINLIEKVGEPDARFLLGVHYNTLYKWRIKETDPEEGRTPPAAVETLADYLLYLLVEMEWDVDEIKAIKEYIDGEKVIVD